MLRTQRMDIYKCKKKLSRYLKKQSNETENALIDSWYKSYATNEQPLEENEKQRIRHSINSAVKAATIKPSVIQLPIFRIAATIVVATGMCIVYSRI
jgi:transmembrane sensor